MIDTGFIICTDAFIFASSWTKNQPYSYIRLSRIATHSALRASTAHVCTKSGGSNGHCNACTLSGSHLIVFSILRICPLGTKIVSASRSTTTLIPILAKTCKMPHICCVAACSIITSPSVSTVAAIKPPTSK